MEIPPAWSNFEIIYDNWVNSDVSEDEIEYLELSKLHETSEEFLIHQLQFNNGLQHIDKFFERQIPVIIQNRWKNLASFVARAVSIMYRLFPKTAYSIQIQQYWELLTFCTITRHIRYDNRTRILSVGIQMVFSFQIDTVEKEYQTEIVKHFTSQTEVDTLNSERGNSSFDKIQLPIKYKITESPVGLLPAKLEQRYKKPNMRQFRQLLLEAFSDDELHIFCYDHFEELRNTLSDGLEKMLQVQKLIEFCDKREQFGKLAKLLAEERPEKYKVFQDSLFERSE